MSNVHKLIPYAGKDPTERPIVWEAGRLRVKALYLFNEGLRTDQIARDLGIKEFEVANALAEARDAARQQ